MKVKSTIAKKSRTLGGVRGYDYKIYAERLPVVTGWMIGTRTEVGTRLADQVKKIRKRRTPPKIKGSFTNL